MNAFAPLRDELDRWQADGRAAAFWWRDDDAAHATPALTRLLRVRAECDAPLALAVVPAAAEDALAAMLAGEPGVAVLQHGWAHRDHAAAGERKIELGGGRALWDIAAELAQGRERLIALFGDALLPVLVPPWNRIDGGLLPLLPGLGYTALSGWKARPAPEAAIGLGAVNAHVDVIDWRGTRGFAGDAAAIGQAVAHLAAKRTGAADADEPTGLLTHHLAHDEDCWNFVARFLAMTRDHPAVRWLHPRAVFAPDRDPLHRARACRASGGEGASPATTRDRGAS